MEEAKAIRLLERLTSELAGYPNWSDFDRKPELTRAKLIDGQQARKKLLVEAMAFLRGMKKGQREGPNLKAATAWLKQMPKANPALTVAFSTLAKAVDDAPGNALLWRQYLEAAKAIQASGSAEGSEQDDFEKVMAALRA